MESYKRGNKSSGWHLDTIQKYKIASCDEEKYKKRTQLQWKNTSDSMEWENAD